MRFLQRDLPLHHFGAIASTKPSYQQIERTPDVSYNANPGTGFAVYDSVPLSGASGWFCFGGTSAGSPQWAALLAISNSIRVANRKARLSGTNTVLYSPSKQSAAANFHPITAGTNGPAARFAPEAQARITSMESERLRLRRPSMFWPRSSATLGSRRVS